MKIIIFSFFLHFVVSQEHRFRCDYTYSKDGNGYLKYHEIPANWHEARLRCYLEGATLASPLTPELSKLMSEIQTERDTVGCGIYTGIHSTISRGDFTSIEGVPLSMIPHSWAKGEPDNEDDAESCLVMLTNGTLADAKCSETLPYVCYEEASQFMYVNQCGTTDYEYFLDESTGNCYKFHKVPRTWSRANMACMAEGGHLVIINSEVEANVVRKIFLRHPPHSIQDNIKLKGTAFSGFYDWNEHGEFLTIQGETLTETGYSKFVGGEPNNDTEYPDGPGQFCGAVIRSGLLVDMWCNRLSLFICEKRPDSLQTCA